MNDNIYEPNEQIVNVIEGYYSKNPDLTAEEIIEAEKSKGNILVKKTVEIALDIIKANKPLSKEELLEILGVTVKHDNINKLITFFSMLSAYTNDNQFNVSFRAPSASGKSYIPCELTYFFPDAIEYAGASPTSFIHDRGEWDNEKKAIIVSLEREILIFVDMPHNKLLEALRPLLSHDKKELHYTITDRKEKYGIRTKHVIIRGFPSVVFCSGLLSMNEQEATRSFILSPEITEEKLREGIYLKAQKMGNSMAFKEYLSKNKNRELLKKRVKLISESGVIDIIVPNINEVVERFLRNKKLKPRHQRDIGRLINIVKSLALLNLWHRQKDDKGNVIASQEDIETGFEIWEQISESQELGIPPYVYQFYKEIILSTYSELNCGLSRKELLASHYKKTGRALPDWQLRQEIIPMLETAGLITQELNQDNKREKLIHPTIELNKISENKVSDTLVEFTPQSDSL